MLSTESTVKRGSNAPASNAATYDSHPDPAVVHLAHIGVPFTRSGSHDPETHPPIVVTGKANGIFVRCLVDSGASANFISFKLVEKARNRGTPFKIITGDQRMTVTLGDGSASECNQVAPNIPMRLGMGGHVLRDALSCRVTPLMEPFDIVLGTPWLAKHNPVFDWHTGAIKIETASLTVRGSSTRTVVLQGLQQAANLAENAVKKVESEESGENEPAPRLQQKRISRVRSSSSPYAAPALFVN